MTYDSSPASVAASGAGERGGAQNLLDLRVREDVLLADQLENPVARFQRLCRQLGRLVVSDDGVERGHRSDARLEIVLADIRIGGDAFDTVLPQCLRRVHEQRLRLEDAGGHDGLERIELKLPRLRRE